VFRSCSAFDLATFKSTASLVDFKNGLVEEVDQGAGDFLGRRRLSLCVLHGHVRIELVKYSECKVAHRCILSSVHLVNHYLLISSLRFSWLNLAARQFVNEPLELPVLRLREKALDLLFVDGRRASSACKD